MGWRAVVGGSEEVAVGQSARLQGGGVGWGVGEGGEGLEWVGGWGGGVDGPVLVPSSLLPSPQTQTTIAQLTFWICRLASWMEAVVAATASCASPLKIRASTAR